MSQLASETTGYISRLYNRAWELVQPHERHSEESRPLLHGQSSASGEYGAVPSSSQRPAISKPRPVQSPVKVEAKVWFANERTWISWLRASILIGTMALALFNGASYYKPTPSEPNDPFEPGPVRPGNPALYRTVRNFGIIYAMISVLTLLWGLYSYQRRVTLIKARYAGSFGAYSRSASRLTTDDLVGPPLICAAIFCAVLLNYIVTGALTARRYADTSVKQALD